MGKHGFRESSDIDAELPVGGGPLEMSLATGRPYHIRLSLPHKWIDIDLVDELGRPAAGEVYRVELPDGTIMKEDRLDRNGYACVEGFSAEECIISFPLLDLDAWSYLGYSE